MCNCACFLCGDRDECDIFKDSVLYAREFYRKAFITKEIEHSNSDKTYNEILEEYFSDKYKEKAGES